MTITATQPSTTSATAAQANPAPAQPPVQRTVRRRVTPSRAPRSRSDSGRPGSGNHWGVPAPRVNRPMPMSAALKLGGFEPDGHPTQSDVSRGSAASGGYRLTDRGIAVIGVAFAGVVLTAVLAVVGQFLAVTAPTATTDPAPVVAVGS